MISTVGRADGSLEITSKGIIGEPLRNSDHRNKDFLGLVCTNY